MEYKSNDEMESQRFGASSSQGGQGDEMSAGRAGNRSSDAFSDTSGTMGRESLGQQNQSTTQRATDTARNAAAQVKDKASQVGTQVKDKASNLKTTLADKLEAGAEKLRQRGGAMGDQMSEGMSEGQSSTAQQGKQAMNRVVPAVATGMEKSAEWLRTGDMSSLTTGIESQVRTNPGRALLVALGVGYVLGKAFTGRRE
jgi:ElaB/YqjD/DUF883 family membrane-anchored ribosome-binding protein